MIRRLLSLVSLSIIAIASSAFLQPTLSASSPCMQGHEAWLTNVVEKMESIKPGMTRMDLLRVFKAEGRLSKSAASTGLRRTFFSRDYPQFRVDVEFKPVGSPNLLGPIGLISPEDNQDIIIKISKPYLQSATTD